MHGCRIVQVVDDELLENNLATGQHYGKRKYSMGWKINSGISKPINILTCLIASTEEPCRMELNQPQNQYTAVPASIVTDEGNT